MQRLDRDGIRDTFLLQLREALDPLEAELEGDELSRTLAANVLDALGKAAREAQLPELHSMLDRMRVELMRSDPQPELTEKLLFAHEWLRLALEAAQQGADPSPSAEATAQVLFGAMPRYTDAQPPTPHVVERTQDDLDLFAEFLQESHEGLSQVDDVLLDGCTNGVDPEAVDAIFRTFHSMKGVAGFLGLDDLQHLTHRTETLLDEIREGQYALHGPTIELVLDATGTTRGILHEIEAGLSAARTFERQPDYLQVLTKLDAFLAGAHGSDEVAIFPPEARLGEILVQTEGITSTSIDRALNAQPEAELPIGQLLVKQEIATTQQVVRAVHTQQRARGQGAARTKLRELVKVDLARVDQLVDLIGELVIVESMVNHAPELEGHRTGQLRDAMVQFTKITRDLQSLGTRMRMVPLQSTFQKMARLVRDLSQKSGKDVRLVYHGEGTEMDRTLVDRIADPLVHLVRNAVDHGVEPQAERLAAGKPAMGTLTLSARHEAGGISIVLKDDGAGLNREAILDKAISKGLIEPDEALTDSEVWRLVFAPGFSTAAQVTQISGRGVGMDVVRRNVEAVRGRVSIESAAGEGTTIKIELPLTLAIIDGMLIRCGHERYILPTLSVVESLQPTREMLFSLAGQRTILNLRDRSIPLTYLGKALDIPDAVTDPVDGLVVVVEHRGQLIGLVVDEVIVQQQVVIKSLGESLNQAEPISGAAILSDGQVGLILNIDELTRSAGLTGVDGEGGRP